MKYNEKNKPLVCMMTQSTCYKGTRKFTPKGVLWHSTGANNPWLKRYVQPDDNAADRAEWLARLGKNQYANDWNHIDRQAGLNFWIGKLADGTVAAVQTMPWDYRPWGCGSGNNGSCNNTHIQFEICEDALNDASYFNACYQEACEMTAYLCKMFGIDPKGTVSYNGLQVPTIIDHTGSHALGLGSNHGDIQHWSRRYGKTMENVRNDVAAILAADATAPTTPSVPAQAEDNAKAIWDRLYAAIQNPYGVAGVMGNFMAESSLRANNLQNSYEKTLGMTDEQYTTAVDNGSYTNFIQDKAGYGLYQATYWSIKESLLNYSRANGKSIGDRDMQVDHFLKMMREEYTAIWKVLTTAKYVREASDAVLLKFERPEDQSEAVQVKRAGYGEEFLAKYGKAAPVTPAEDQPETEQLSAAHAKYINSTGTHYISNSGSDENGAYSGGQAGDQTGKEWRMRDWYN
ncbi:MAG: N-acetylmuramoyl-L-alanine amidase, partial [Oscillospiraceae bacterium]|nr:N-acetylmuramoyl-L-alanine amidase [Oscillospiraceae bacterium]